MQSNLPTTQTPQSEPFTIQARIRSLHHAAHGIAALIRREHNARVHLGATCLVLLAAIWLHVGAEDIRWLLAAIALVWIAEAFNTAIECVCDLAHPGFHPKIKHIKDVAAGAVLLAVLTAAAIGASIFWPYLAARIG